MAKEGSFVRERIDSLYDIDCKIVSLLDKMSGIFETYSSPKDDVEKIKEQIQLQTKGIYSTLSDVAVELRKEVKIMDENIGCYNKNKDNVMILPLPVDQKNTRLGNLRMKQEIEELDKFLGNTDSDVKMEDSESEA
jgi:mediator of RNA polymerase II transcription subunit 11